MPFFQRYSAAILCRNREDIDVNQITELLKGGWGGFAVLYASWIEFVG